MDERLEHVGVVVRALALHHHAETLEAHTGIDVLGFQRLQCAVGLAVELHEHKVPYLNDLRVVLVHKVFAGHLGLLFVGTNVDVYLRAGTARTLVAHLPEVVFLRAAQDAFLADVLLPEVVCLHVHLEALLLVASEDGDIEPVLVYFHHLGEEFPSESDGLFLEVVAERPVAQHLEHRVVVGVVTHLFEVVVLAADAQALLAVGGARPLALLVAKEDILELVHAGVGEHQRRVILDNHRCTRHHVMALTLKIIEECFAYFVRCHIQ